MSKVFIITVKGNIICPNINNDGWKSMLINETTIQLLNDTVKQILDNDNKLLNGIGYKLFEKDGDAFNVYVVACLDGTDWTNTEINKKKTSFLEGVVSQIIDQVHTCVDNIFLIAHDEDFNTSTPDVIASQLPHNEQSNYPNLSKLVNIQHVYLFQHEPSSCKIYPFLQNLLVFDKPDMCVSIIDIIGETREMLTFFQEVDKPKEDNVKNIYSELKYE